MTTIPFALSIHKFVNSVGADVGFASIFAVAILILLYFAHARETATLRDRLDEAHQRISGLEARIAQMLQAQAAAQRGRAPGVTPAPVTPAPVRPMGSAISSVRRVPTPAAAVAGAATAGAARAVASGMAPAAPVGMAAPALASATKLIPDAETFSPNGSPDDTLFVPAPVVAAATAAAGNGHSRSERPAPLTEATQAIPAVAAAAARTPSASPRGGVAAPPRVQMGAESGAAGGATAAASGAAAAGGAATAAAAGGGSRRPTPPQRFLPPTGGDPKRSRGRFARLSGRVLPLLIGGVAVVVVIVGLVIIINTGGSSNTPVNHTGNNPTGQKVSNQQHHQKAPPFKASKVTVAVLNGTAVSGLAGDVATKLAGHGYNKGNATNAASQTQSSTVVYYITGAGAAANKTAGQHVAKALTLPLSRVRPATQTAIQSCSISATGAALNSCGATVIVSVGSDRANLASGSSSG